MKVVQQEDPNELAKSHLNKIDLSQSFVIAINYGGRVEVVTKADLFQGSGLVEILRHQVMKSLNEGK